MWVLEGSREKIWQEIALHPAEGEVRVKTKPSRALFLRLLEQTQVKKIYITDGLCKTIPKKVAQALEGAGVELVIIEKSAGRPAKFDEGKKAEAQKMLSCGKTAVQISRKLGLPTTAIYAWKRKMGKGEGFLQEIDST